MSDKTTPLPTRPGEAPDDPGRVAPKAREGDTPKAREGDAPQAREGEAPDQRQGLERAAGTIDRPIGTDDAQAGDRSERAAELGGPIDVFPTRRDRSGVEDPYGTEDPSPDAPT
jgi:hypothetical protein